MRKLEDTYQHKGLRKKLIDSLRTKGITSELILEAMYNVPRHFFLDSAFDKIAYEDRAFPIGHDQTISQPYTVAYQTQLLNVQRGNKILEIGTGSVYQASILAELGAWVYTIERQRKLYDANKNFFFKVKYPSIKFFYGDGFEGLPTYSPFDKILITAAAPFVPPKLVDQLKTSGQMVLPVDKDGKQQMLRITKKNDGSYTEEWFDYFSFVPMLTGKNG